MCSRQTEIRVIQLLCVSVYMKKINPQVLPADLLFNGFACYLAEFS